MSEKSRTKFRAERKISHGEAVRHLTDQIRTIAKRAVTEYKLDFDDIIKSECGDIKRIEHMLDGMLDFCFDKNMIGVFKKLCRYYYDIDQSAAVAYVCAYRDMWDPEEERPWADKDIDKEE